MQLLSLRIFISKLEANEQKPAVCEFVELNSEAYQAFGESKKQLSTTVKEGENLPVFDFVIYHTSGEQ